MNSERMQTYTVVPRPLSNDPRFSQCIYRYSHASKRFVEVYIYKILKLLEHFCVIDLKTLMISIKNQLALLYNFTYIYTNIPSCRWDES